MHLLTSRRAKVVVAPVLIGLAAVAIGGIAFASVPGPDGTINGCYSNSKGTLRVIDSNNSCSASETAISWNQEGPAGPAGSMGPTGPAGPTGPLPSVYTRFEKAKLVPVVPFSYQQGFVTDAQSALVSVSLPVGSYLVTGDVWIASVADNQSVRCTVGSDTTGSTLSFQEDMDFSRTVPMTLIVPSTVSLRCDVNGSVAGPGQSVIAQDLRITAVPTGGTAIPPPIL